MIFNSFAVANDYNFGAQWPNGRSEIGGGGEGGMGWRDSVPRPGLLLRNTILFLPVAPSWKSRFPLCDYHLAQHLAKGDKPATGLQENNNTFRES